MKFLVLNGLKKNLKAAAENAAIPPITDYEGDDASLFGKITEPGTNVVRVANASLPEGLAGYLERVRSGGSGIRTWRPGIVPAFFAAQRVETDIPVSFADHQPDVKMPVSNDLLIPGSDILLAAAREISETVKARIGRGAVVSQLALRHIGEEEIRMRVRRGAEGFNVFAPHFDFFSEVPGHLRRSEKKPVTFTFLNTFSGSATLYARAATLREAFIAALKLDETLPGERLIAQGLRRCDYQTLMKAAYLNIGLRPKSFASEGCKQFWDSAGTGETVLFREMAVTTGRSQDFISALHSSPDTREGDRTLLIGRGYYLG